MCSVANFDVLNWLLAVVRRYGSPSPPFLALMLLRFRVVSSTLVLSSVSRRGPVINSSISLHFSGSTCVARRLNVHLCFRLFVKEVYTSWGIY